MKIVVGLGNSGARYIDTRHNSGVLVLRALAQHWGVSFKNHGGIAEVAHYENNNNDTWLIFPTQLMNNSGPALVQTLSSLSLSPKSKDILVVHDDIDIALGEAKLSFASGSAGHNGVESVMQALGERTFWRLRIGIHHGSAIEERRAYVLERMNAEEKEHLRQVLARTSEGIELWQKEPHKAQIFFNAA